jgi:cell division GTPase FtsZ
MKLLVIGVGQCGGRIADEFSRLSQRARAQRGIEIVTGAFAVNTDEADLSGLTSIRSDYHHRILIGGRKTDGHGVGKINEIGAQIAKENGDKVVDAVRTAKRFYETDAFLIIGSTGGGTGSGGLPIITQMVKERYMDKPAYALAILPFEHEEQTEERSLYNTATCLKTTYSVADAVFVIDNQRYLRKDASLGSNLELINQQIVEPFFNLLCCGEEKKRKYIGGKVLDAGDIIATLEGWTVIGHGKSQVPMFRRLPFEKTRDFHQKSRETHRGMEAMDQALSELSLRCRPEDAGKAVYLLCAPHREMNADIVKELGGYLRELTQDGMIRSGDYPREKSEVSVTLIFSQLSDVDRVKEFYNRSAELIPLFQQRQGLVEDSLKEIEDAGKDIPSLL